MKWYARAYLAVLALSHCLIPIAGFLQSCGETKNGLKGVVKSPNYPQNYPSNSHCTWAINVSKGHTIRLAFLHFVLERDFGCSHDFLRLYDGGSEKAVMIGKYCGGMRPFTVQSTSNQMTIVLISDSSLTFSGFRAKFTAVPSISPPSTKETTIQTTQPPPTTTTAALTTTPLPTTTPIPTTTQPTTKPTTQTTTVQPSTEPAIAIYFAKPFKNVTTIKAGQDYRFICQVRGSKKVIPIKWSKSGHLLQHDPSNKQSEIIRKHKRKSILLLKKVSKQDSGIYGCHATDPNGQIITMYGKLSVEEPKPTPTTIPQMPVIFSANLNVTANIHRKIELSCMANGTQPITIRWVVDRVYIKGKQRRTKGGYKSVYNLYVQRVHYVRCVAENRYGTATRTGVVRVKTRGREPNHIPGTPVAITMATLNITAKIGQKLILRCSANGTPPVKIRWFLHGRYYERKQRRNQDTHTSSFELTVEKESVLVKCVAQNPYGVDVKHGDIRIRSNVVAKKAVGPWDSFKPGQNMFYVVVVGGVVFLTLLLIGIICFRKKITNPRYKAPEQVSLEQLTKNPIFERNSNTYVNPKIERWDVHRNNIEFIKDIEDGTFSRLFLGRMTHASRGEQDTLVHVKVLKESTQTDANKDAFEEEAIELTTTLHPNVQSLVGVCVTGRPLCLVFECLDRGDLNQFLRDSGCSHYIIRERPNSSMDPDTKLSKLDQLCIAKQIAAGMHYLSSRDYQHRQLCTKNCMISKNMVVKVANIGLRSTRPNTSYNQLGPIEKSRYPVRWLPLESVESGKFTDTTDVWSFGILLWEIYSHGMTPYYGMNNDEVIALVREGDILPLPKECPKEMYDVMQDCWSLVTHERPSFRFLHEKISALLTGVAV